MDLVAPQHVGSSWLLGIELVSYIARWILNHWITREALSFFFLMFLFFWPHRVAHGILVPQRGIKPIPPALEMQSPYCWTTREFPVIYFIYSSVYIGEGNGTPLQYSCWKIPWTEEPGRLQSMGVSQSRTRLK